MGNLLGEMERLREGVLAEGQKIAGALGLNGHTDTDLISSLSDLDEWMAKYDGKERKPSIEDVEKVAIPIIAQTDGLRREKYQKKLAKIIGCTVKVINQEVTKRKPPKEESQGGSAVIFEEVPLWDEPVDGAALLDEIESTVKRFVILSDQATIGVVLWVVFPYLIAESQVAPLLAISSPEMRCGKSTLLSIVSSLVPKPLASSNISGPALFRSIEKWGPTLLIDEGDSFLGDNEELRGIINSGHTRTSSFVIRTVGEDHEPMRFSTWGPKVIALIGKLPSTVADRSIIIPLKRKGVGEKVAKLNDRHAGTFLTLRQKISRWTTDNARTFRLSNPEPPEALNDRAADNWMPLLAIADAAGGEWPHKARKAAELLSEMENEGGLGVRLLEDIREVITGRIENGEFIRSSLFEEGKFFSSTLFELVMLLEERPWKDVYRGKGLTPNRMAGLLKPYAINSRSVRVGAKTAKGYLREEFNDAFARYLAPLPSSEENAGGESVFRGISKPAVNGVHHTNGSMVAVKSEVGSGEGETWDLR